MYWKNVGLIACAGTSLGLAVFCAFQSVPRQTVDLAVTPLTRDFGKVFQKARLHADFQLSNRSRAPIKIAEVLKDCDCTDVKIRGRDLAPGQSTTISATWNTGTRRGRSGTQLVVLYTNPMGGSPRTLRIPMGADVIPDVTYFPSELDFAGGERLDGPSPSLL
jgi:hypothetical protein